MKTFNSFLIATCMLVMVSSAQAYSMSDFEVTSKFQGGYPKSGLIKTDGVMRSMSSEARVLDKRGKPLDMEVSAIPYGSEVYLEAEDGVVTTIVIVD